MVLAILKQWWLELIIAVLIFILFGYTCYQLGLQAARSKTITPSQATAFVAAESSPQTELNSTMDDKMATTNAFNGSRLYGETSLRDGRAVSEPVAAYEVVYGSVNGSKYYNYGCKAGNRIKPENKVYFSNAAEALKTGYKPSVTCDF